MRRSFYIGIGLFILFFASLPRAAEKRPAWIDGEASFYSEQEYLTGVGYGNSRKDAEDQAYAAIAKIFRAQVQAQTREAEEFRQGEGQGKVDVQRTIDIGQIIEVSTQKALENVRIAEHWEEPTTHVHYALATLSRAQATSSLTEKIDGLDRSIREALQQADASSEPLPHLRALRRAKNALLLREVYNTDLRIVHRSGKGIDPPVSSSALQEKIDRFMSENLRLSVTASGPEAGPIQTALTVGLTRQG
ncbi:MAG TPA: LPP20 family lipoprotein, partial [Nitrospiria bacterium]|nr:LPP20 family lipoprotein [Nitrospiria bacterium]